MLIMSVIYRALNPTRHYTHATVKSTALAFGEGLRDSWEWAKGDVLAIYALNDIDIPPCVYGALHAGGVVSPANPAYSAEELAFMLSDCGAKAIVTQKALLPVALKAAEKAGLPRERIILLGEERDPEMRFKHFTSIRMSSSTNVYRRRKLNPDKDLAFLVYSSGTTGLPKGVMLSHRNIIANVLMITGSIGKCYGWDRDKFLGVLPFYHIYGAYVCVAEFAAGACVWGYAGGTTRDSHHSLTS
jgi:acyl-CoA synthetase (AMP-forming)/AMP-acid ligase II